MLAERVIPSGSVAVMVPVCREETTWVVVVNVAEEDPLGTVIIAGTVTPGRLLVNDIAMPPAGAFALRLTVPVAEVPPTTAEGLNVTLVSSTGWRVREMPIVLPDAIAFTRTGVDLVTPSVVQEKLTLWDPAATKTEPGTFTNVEALASVILTALDAAGPFSDTVPFDVPPPAKTKGLNDKPERTAGVTVILAF